MKRFDDYDTAAHHAREQATLLAIDHGIERSKEFGRDGYTVKMLPRPESCQGHELRMERVKPGEPQSDRLPRDTCKKILDEL